MRRDNLIGTYLHGPLLPKNAWLADHLIALALERRYGARPELEPLDDALEAAAHESARAAAGRLTQRPLEPKPPSPRADSVSAVGLDRLGERDRDEHQLGDAVAGGDPEDLGRVGVEQQHAQLRRGSRSRSGRGC